MTRAPFDDWRRGGEGGGQGEAGQQQAGESGEGWRTSGRRWGGKCLEIGLTSISHRMSIV